MSEIVWDDVRVLLALLRAPSLEGAAGELAVNRSTVSRRLAALEAQVGAPLFARTSSGLTPTSLAIRMRTTAEAMESAAAALRATAADRGVDGTVRLATTDALGTLLINEGLLAMQDRHPNLALELLTGNKPLDVARGEADIAVRIARMRGSSLRARCVARSSIAVLAAPSYLRARGPIASAEALEGHDVVLPGGELARLPETRWLAAIPGVRVVFRSNSMPALVAAATAGRGLVPLTLNWESAELQRVLVLDHLPQRAMWLVTRESDARRLAVQVVCDEIRTILARRL